MVILYIGLGVRLFHVQITSHKTFKKIAKNSYTVQIDRVSPKRGSIYDRNGIELAVNKHTYSIGFNFRNVSMRDKLKKDLIRILCLDDKILAKKISNKRFDWLSRHIDPLTMKNLQQYKKNGLVIVKENSRFYPQAPMASQIIGCVGIDNQGLSGIEYNFEKQLRESDKSYELLRDAKGRVIYLAPDETSTENSVASVYLSIDSNLQYIAEREIKKGYKKYRPKWAMAIIQNPNNGEILAMAEYPGFDNNMGVPENMEKLKNMAVSYIFEPGSTFKIVTAAAAFEEKLVSNNEIINCENGEYEVGGFPIRDFEPHKELSFMDCMVYSSNIGLSKIGARLDRRLLFKYARDFGFGNFTGLRLPGEARGILRKPDRWSGTSLSRISFGQEIGVTGVQLIGAISVVANGGVLYEPRIVRKIITKGSTRKYDPLPIRRVISKETADKMKNILIEVVKRGSGLQAKVSGYLVAGKTGTAQKYNPQTQTYYKDKYVALFGGFVPAEDPVLSILVVYDEPEVEYHWGGYVAAPVFSKIAEAALNYLNIPPKIAD